MATEFVDLVVNDEDEEKNATGGEGDAATRLREKRRRTALIVTERRYGGPSTVITPVQLSRRSLPAVSKKYLAAFF